MLPHFYSHYGPWVDHFNIFDNGSTDGSQDIVLADTRSTLHHLQDTGASHELSALSMYNTAWKNSRGNADWVLICDIDEHIWHGDILEHLRVSQSRGVTAIRPEAYEMVAEFFPTGLGPLWSKIKEGVRLPFFDKLQIFAPDAILETNFGVGRHTASMDGNCTIEANGELKLLHFKQLGADYVVSRHAHLSRRLGRNDLENGWGAHWGWDPRRIKANHRSLKAKATRLPFLP